MGRVSDDSALGARFATALAAKDFDAAVGLAHAAIDFRAMTPRMHWEAGDPAQMRDILHKWFEESDEIEALDQLETDAFADCERVGYRVRVRNPEGVFLVEQQAYLTPRDGRIGWMRVLCSGYRPVG